MGIGTTPPETIATRLALVVGAQCTFAMLVRLVTGAPPAFVVTIGFGMFLALLLAAQAHGTEPSPGR
jgi:hypothetical protein